MSRRMDEWKEYERKWCGLITRSQRCAVLAGHTFFNGIGGLFAFYAEVAMHGL